METGKLLTSKSSDMSNTLKSKHLQTVGGFRVHTYNLLKEVLDCNNKMAIFQIPFNVFGKLLAAVGERAAELNDPKLNALMCRLTIYSVADPESPDYDPEILRKVLNEEPI